ncbi:MAG TPA: hypothetical protein ENI51_06525 [Candidatus Atribacteria bacterium]|nr:hypothetical protein [Candidatus Atribacteria bacterium]
MWKKQFEFPYRIDYKNGDNYLLIHRGYKSGVSRHDSRFQNYWLVTYRNYGKKPIRLGKFRNKADALKYAKGWMKKNDYSSSM